MSLYRQDNYRAALRFLVEGRMTFQELAARMKVQKSYLSRVLKGNADLSSDQVFSATLAFGLSEPEAEYLQLLLERDRSGLVERRKALDARLLEIRKRHLDSRAHLSRDTVVTDAETLRDYYLDPLQQLVHIALGLVRGKAEPAKLAKALGLPPTRLQELLAALERQGLAKHEKGAWAPTERKLHLPKDSPLFRPYLAGHRLLSLERSRALAAGEGYQFSVIFSADEKTREKVQEAFLAFLKKIQDEVRAAPAENVYQMGFDLLPWL
jgi:transcriptional regulator with XRE-family HTH domain/DNA-binding Lrp family transcriptional regulator